MKKLFTLVLGLTALIAGVNAQQSGNVINVDALRPTLNSKVANLPAKKQLGASDSRAQVIPMVLDYDAIDENYAALVSSGTYTRFSWELNNRLPNDSTLGLRYIVALYDTIVVLDANNDVFSFPKSATSFTLDSLQLPFVHKNTSNQNDTIKLTIYDRATMTIPAAFTAGNVNGTSLWDTTIVTNTSLSPGDVFDQFFLVYPGLSFAAGSSFAVRVDYSGPVLDPFYVLVGWRDDCGEECSSASSVIEDKTIAKVIYNNSALIFNGTEVVTDCNDNNVTDLCEYFYFQNTVMYPFITATIQAGVNVLPSTETGVCADDVIDLRANVYGTEAEPFTFQWTTTGGTLLSDDQSVVSLVAGNTTDTVTVVVTDGNDSTYTATFIVRSNAINLNIVNNPQPVTLPCGGQVTLNAATSGNQQGRTFTWSTGKTGTNSAAASEVVTFPGTYSVTVTNAAGCSSSKNVQVVYASGTTNTVAITPPTDRLATPGLQICPQETVTFTNASTNTGAGWLANWDLGDGSTFQGLNASNMYSPGQYTVRLVMDSAGCEFTGTPLTFTVLTVQACQSIGIEDVDFNNGISLIPNPTAGNLNISVAGVEKNLSVRVYNILGSEVYTFNTTEVASTFNKTIDLSNLNSGTYLVKVQTGSKVAVKRVVVSK